MTQEALVDERLERVEVGVADFLGRVEDAAAGEDSEAGEELPLVVGEQVMRPFNRRAQGLLARVGAAAALEQIEPLGEPFEHLPGREDSGAGGREL